MVATVEGLPKEGRRRSTRIPAVIERIDEWAKSNDAPFVNLAQLARDFGENASMVAKAYHEGRDTHDWPRPMTRAESGRLSKKPHNFGRNSLKERDPNQVQKDPAPKHRLEAYGRDEIHEYVFPQIPNPSGSITRSTGDPRTLQILLQQDFFVPKEPRSQEYFRGLSEREASDLAGLARRYFRSTASLPLTLSNQLEIIKHLIIKMFREVPGINQAVKFNDPALERRLIREKLIFALEHANVGLKEMRARALYPQNDPGIADVLGPESIDFLEKQRGLIKRSSFDAETIKRVSKEFPRAGFVFDMQTDKGVPLICWYLRSRGFEVEAISKKLLIPEETVKAAIYLARTVKELKDMCNLRGEDLGFGSDDMKRIRNREKTDPMFKNTVYEPMVDESTPKPKMRGRKQSKHETTSVDSVQERKQEVITGAFWSFMNSEMQNNPGKPISITKAIGKTGMSEKEFRQLYTKSNIGNKHPALTR